MPELPSGTVTFLFTDIEGSTRLWEQHAEAMQEALARHDALLSGCIQQHGGAVIKSRGEGDSFFAVFARATDAVGAALALQQALLAEPWPPQISLRVRVALHTGDAQLRSADYYGSAVNRCARLRAAAHGGQVLLSLATQELVRDALREPITLRDLGEQRLRDLARPERVFQLLHPDLPADFPPLQSLDVVPNNLPQQLTSFIGREQEMREIQRLLSTTRLLTLTGAGGCGKTRLALQLAADLLHEYRDGVWLVELASLADPALVPQTVASALSVRAEPGRPLIETLADYLKPRSLLLVLDNCEHLLSACAQVVEVLLRRCPHLRTLATSREGLGIAGELTYLVPSLSLPDIRRLRATGANLVSALTQYEAARLFIERAAFSQPRFAVSSSNAVALAQVCHRLDGIPLAIELAAARVKALSVEKIAARLDDRFRLLAGGSRTALPRHQTLRALIDWSYDLLSEAERTLLRRLSVFVAGWTLEAAEAVCSGDGLDALEVMDLLTQLVDKSLVVYEERADAGGAEGTHPLAAGTRPLKVSEGSDAGRYRLLETIRQYARDRLLESGEAAAVRGRHLGWVVALAERAGPELFGREQAAWLQWLDQEHDNLRAALDWSLESGAGEAGLRLCGSVWRFWYKRSYMEEGRERLAAALSRPEAAERTPLRAIALDGAGVLALNQGEFATARSHYEEVLAIGRELGDKQVIAVALNGAGHVALLQGSDEQARLLFEQGLALAREAGDRWEAAFSLHCRGLLAVRQQDDRAARSFLEESLTIRRELGDKAGIASTLGILASRAKLQGDYGAARALYVETLAIERELGGKGGLWTLFALGDLARLQGDYTSARSHFEELLAAARELPQRRHQWGTADALYGLGQVALNQGDFASARSRFEESRALWREMGDWSVSHSLQGLGDVARYQGDAAAAVCLYEEGLAIWRDLEEDWGRKRATAGLLLGLGMAARKQGNDQRAVALCRESLVLYREVGGKAEIAACLEALGNLASTQGQPPTKRVLAARLLGAAAALRATIGAPLAPADRPEYERTVAAAQLALGDDAFAAAWAGGQALPLEEAIQDALKGDDPA